MSSQEIQKAESALQQLSNIEVAAQPVLPFDLIERPENKTVKLVANSGHEIEIKAKNQWYRYRFEEPVFITMVTVNTRDFFDSSEFEFGWSDVSGDFYTQRVGNENNRFFIYINDLINEIKFRPPKTIWAKPYITSVKVNGIAKQSISSFLSKVSSIENYKDQAIKNANTVIQKARDAEEKIGSLGQRRAEIEDLIANQARKIEELNANIGRLTEERKSLVQNRDSLSSKLSEIEEDIQDAENKRRSIDDERRSIEREIEERRRELRGLQDDINMFPTEIGGFVEQGVQNIRSYWRIAWLPLVIIALMTGLLIVQAADLTTVLDEHDNARIWSILLTRIPYVLIATAVIASCYKIARLFIVEIMRINSQKLNLSKISIVASDVANASAEGLNMSDEEIHAHVTHLKMELLKDHMKEYLSKDYSYKPPKSIFSNLQKTVSSKPEESLEGVEVDNDGDR